MGCGAEVRLREEIPLSGAMGTRVVEATNEGVVLSAPLEPNMNHRATAFGGSVSALALLAGWMLVDLRLGEADHHAHTVVQSSDVRFLLPARETFEAHATVPDDDAWLRFVRTLERKRRARLRLQVEVRCGAALVATVDAAYVSLTDGA